MEATHASDMEPGTDSTSPSPPHDRDDQPSFDLTSKLDDDDHPSEITVFPDAGDEAPETTWLTIDVAHAVPLTDAR